MSAFDAIGSGFENFGQDIAGPFEQFGSSFETLFTDPGKLTTKDFITIGLPIPGVGSAIAYDIDHPEAAISQASLISGAAAIASGTGATAAAASERYAAAQWEAPLSEDVAAQAAADAQWAAPLSDAAEQDAIDASIQWEKPLAGEGGSGVGSLISGGASKVGSVIKDTALVSAAARGILAPWQSAAAKVRDMFSGGSSSAPSRTFSASGGPLPAGIPAAPTKAAAPALLIAGAAVAAGLAVWLWRKFA